MFTAHLEHCRPRVHHMGLPRTRRIVACWPLSWYPAGRCCACQRRVKSPSRHRVKSLPLAAHPMHCTRPIACNVTVQSFPACAPPPPADYSGKLPTYEYKHHLSNDQQLLPTSVVLTSIRVQCRQARKDRHNDDRTTIQLPWITAWEQMTHTEVVYEQRPHDVRNYHEYLEWYIPHTHTRLTRPSPKRLEHVTYEERIQLGFDQY